MLQPRFREIIWHPDGFVTEEPPRFIVEGHIFQHESMRLKPGFRGGSGPIPSGGTAPGGQFTTVWYSESGQHGGKDCRTLYHMREGNVAFTFVFNPDMQESMRDQLELAAMRALEEGPLKGRRFFMDPVFKTAVLGDFSMRFSIEGEPIRGLHLGTGYAYDWRVFIPEGPERVAIQTAFDLERQQEELRKRIENDEGRKQVRDLKVSLSEALAAIPT